MSAPPALLVAGLGRCGTSLMMQMLAAAGLPCVGEFPAYEVPELNHRKPPLAWVIRITVSHDMATPFRIMIAAATT